MKKLFYSFFAAAALMLSATSCSQEEMIQNETTTGDEVVATFNLEMEGQTASRAIGDGSKVNEVIMAVFNTERAADGTWTVGEEIIRATETVENYTAEVKVRLVKGQTYAFVFWAQVKGGGYYSLTNMKTILLNNYTSNANDENRDAFYAKVDPMTVSGSFSQKVTLKRPFAQLNLGTTAQDIAWAAAAGVTITHTKVKVEGAVYGGLNTFTGEVIGEPVVDFTKASIPDATKEDLEIRDDENLFAIDKYEYLASDYLLASANAELSTTITYELYDGEELINTLTIENAPLQRNYRTNIVGEILTGEGTFNIVIDPIFTNDHNYPKTDSERLQFAALNGGEVTLTNDVTLESPLTVTADMILNLNGQTLTGSLNLAKDSKLVVSNGKIVNTDDTTSGIVSNGNLTLNNVEITSARHALRIESGDVVINGGTYKVEPKSAKTLHALNIGDYNTIANVTIKGGTFIGPKGTNAESGAAVNVYAGSIVTIEGGKFSGGKNKTLSSKGTLVVTNGIFDQDPSSYVTGDNIVQQMNGWYYVSKPVNTVDDFADALNNTSSVKVVEAIDNGSNVIAINNNDVVINMNDMEIKAGGQGTNNYAFNVFGSDIEVNDANMNGAGFAVMDESNVTINSGKIDAKPGKSGRNMFYVINNSSVTVNEGTYTFDRTSCYFVYVDEGSTCYINGGHFEKPLANNASKDSFVNNASTGKVFITGGTFNIDPTNWLAKGYKATKSGKIWTVSKE